MASSTTLPSRLPGPNFKNYPNRIDSHSGTNFATLPSTQPVPDVSVTGLRDQGQYYDYNDVWLFNAFRLSETSQPNAPNTSMMIGFVHNEDYWSNQSPKYGATYKSIGVRYSSDLGLSWTRSVPIITSGVQCATYSACPENFTGTGVFGTVWDPIHTRWVIFAQENWLVMSVSSDPLARPGTWSRIDPVSGETAPGFIGGSKTLSHGDLQPRSGANPSIIRDTVNGVWHMVWGNNGGGIVYSNTTDLLRWAAPRLVVHPSLFPGASYPTLIGDGGDQTTTQGNATFYFTANWPDNWSGSKYGKCLYSVGVGF